MPERVTGRRAVPYGGVGASLVIPQEIWERTLTLVRAFGRRNSEALVFWGGIVSADGSAQVTGVYIPRHAAQGDRVRLEALESRWLLRRLRERDEKLLAQVHSHPVDAFHSSGDDAAAASFHAGYISIVVPCYGRGVRDLSPCAVFEYDGAQFRAVDAASVGARFRVLPLVEERP